jgi:hypothetical protein
MQKTNEASTSWVIDLQLNAVKLRESSAVFRFSRNWSAYFLALLLKNAQRNQSVTALELQRYLQGHGHKTSLNRAQHLRILEELKAFMISPLHAVRAMSITHAPRKASVGPWRLTFISTVEWEVSHRSPPPSPSSAAERWLWPRLLSGEVTSAPRLLQCIGGWVTMEGLAVYSNIKPALDIIFELKKLELSTEALAILSLREMQFLRQLGNWAQATALAELLLADPTPHVEHRAQSYARFMQQRIQYDKQPATAWAELLNNPQPPEPILMACPLALADWHNMQALMLRRAVLANAGALEASVEALHMRALLHIDSAIYQALSFQHWDKLHAYLDNLAYYLQKVEPRGLCTVEDVHDAYALALACADKLDSGHDDATDLIFYAEFWLDRAVSPGSAPHHRSAFFDEKLHPKRFNFWDTMLDRTRAIGSPVQHGMALALSIRWATERQPELPAAWRDKTTLELAQLLYQHVYLRQRLAEDGYGRWLPEQNETQFDTTDTN